MSRVEWMELYGQPITSEQLQALAEGITDGLTYVCTGHREEGKRVLGEAVDGLVKSIAERIIQEAIPLMLAGADQPGGKGRRAHKAFQRKIGRGSY